MYCWDVLKDSFYESLERMWQHWLGTKDFPKLVLFVYLGRVSKKDIFSRCVEMVLVFIMKPLQMPLALTDWKLLEQRKNYGPLPDDSA